MTSNYLDWKVGDRVVCVDDVAHSRYSPWFAEGGLDGLQNSLVYTIRAIGIFRGIPAIWLDEITRPVRFTDPEEPGYAAARFRKVITRKTDISIFTALLNTAFEDLEAEVFDGELIEVPFR